VIERLNLILIVTYRVTLGFDSDELLEPFKNKNMSTGHYYFDDNDMLKLYCQLKYI